VHVLISVKHVLIFATIPNNFGEPSRNCNCCFQSLVFYLIRGGGVRSTHFWVAKDSINFNLGTDPLRTVIKLSIMKTPQLVILCMIWTVHLDLYNQICSTMKNQVISVTFIHASLVIFFSTVENNVLLTTIWCMSKNIWIHLVFHYWANLSV